MFVRTADGNSTPAVLSPNYGCSAWILGAGPSLRSLSSSERQGIERSPAIRLALNHGGRGKDGEGWVVKPTHWTAYDYTGQYSGAVFNDPTITKFVKNHRRGEWVPNTDGLHPHDMPNTYFYDTQDGVSYEEYFNPFSPKVTDCRDSLIASIHLAAIMGARNIYLLGTDMRIPLTQEQLDFGKKHGVSYPIPGSARNPKGEVSDMGTFHHDPTGKRTSDRLSDFITAVARGANKTEQWAADQIGRMRTGREHYSISEVKSWVASKSMDDHYYIMAQRIRLARVSLRKYGINLVSATPNSRLNHFLPFSGVAAILASMNQRTTVEQESTVGAYTGRVCSLAYFQDYPVFTHETTKAGEPKPKLRKQPPTCKPKVPPIPAGDDRIFLDLKGL